MRKPSNGASGATHGDEVADLRLVEQLAADVIAGREEAAQVLHSMGRDASGVLHQIAERTGHPDLKALARRLAATPPLARTNLYDLRQDSVRAIVRQALDTSPLAAELGRFPVESGYVALFDPERIQEALVRGGRPRQELPRIRGGDILPLAVAGTGPVEVLVWMGAAPVQQRVLRLILRVTSGVVFFGPAEAADGPRLGAIRLDPFSTRLDAFLGQGRFGRLKPGLYEVGAHRMGPRGLKVHIAAAPDSGAGVPPVELADLTNLPEAVDEFDRRE